ncbi:MAG: phosphoribosylformylglycinamidine synthase II [Cenarchaeum symbiont of Oopsacas minuta]|nr:phosphoribosylformylglycinamidine synthase II [Cenarchaeum symbiont of Oopsacas minuta]
MPTLTELDVVAAEWSEHCSYKSSKMHLGQLPSSSKHVISEKGYDSGVLDVGDGYVVTVHIESHNHPSAIEPYGGAATGVGGVIRDILSTGTRPIAILDGLRFGNIRKDAHAAWLFRNVVSGIAAYGNCLGIPTVGGEVEFDSSYSGYALVDVAAVGFGKKELMIKNRAKSGDCVVLLGGPTGRDGMGGAQFASDRLESEDRSAVQIPDPFIEKMIIESILEARRKNLIHAMKDLGGGGLSCAISETADALSIGILADVGKVHTRGDDMLPHEVMVSESQERMLVITPRSKIKRLEKICDKFGVPCSKIGVVTADKIMHIKNGSKTVVKIPAKTVANAPLLDLPSSRPKYIDRLLDDSKVKPSKDLSKCLQRLLSSPNIASRQPVYGQYDHEVGIRTMIRPGRDAALLRLDNGRYLSITIDGNPRHCYVNPRHGAAGCFEEACRNVVCTGARPIGMVDHLQFGNPTDQEVFWTFLESIKGIAECAKRLAIPCVGGKVSLYNETPRGSIKPTPVIGVLGLTRKPLLAQSIRRGDLLVIVGRTKNEMGGSEYYEEIHHMIGGICPKVDYTVSRKNASSVLYLVKMHMVRAIHDCSKGGLAVAISEMCIGDNIGCRVYSNLIPSDLMSMDRILFSESHSRYLLAVPKTDLKRALTYFEKRNIEHAVIGEFGGKSISIDLDKRHTAIKLMVDKMQKVWNDGLAGRV